MHAFGLMFSILESRKCSKLKMEH